MQRRDFLKLAGCLPFLPKIGAGQLIAAEPKNLIAESLLGGKPLPEIGPDFTSIIIVTRNRPEYLNVCLQSIAINSINNNYEIIVVDNGSTDKEAKNFLKEISSEVKVIRNEKNLFWGPAINQGVRAANPKAHYFAFMHADTVILRPDWLDCFMNTLAVNQSGLLGINLRSWFIDGKKIDWLGEACMFTSKEAWKQIGPFPNEFPACGPGFIATMRAHNKKLHPQQIKNVVHHYDSFSFDISEYEKHMHQTMENLPEFIKKEKWSS